MDTQLKPDKPEAPQKRRLMDIRPLRRRFAEGIRQIAEVTADRVARMQLRLQLDIQSVKGPIVAWVPPPPGDRLWFSFTSPPELVADARPLVRCHRHCAEQCCSCCRLMGDGVQKIHLVHDGSSGGSSPGGVPDPGGPDLLV